MGLVGLVGRKARTVPTYPAHPAYLTHRAYLTNPTLLFVDVAHAKLGEPAAESVEV